MKKNGTQAWFPSEGLGAVAGPFFDPPAGHKIMFAFRNRRTIYEQKTSL